MLSIKKYITKILKWVTEPLVFVRQQSSPIGYWFTSKSPTHTARFGLDANGSTMGIYSDNKSKWLVSYDSNGVPYIDGTRMDIWTPSASISNVTSGTYVSHNIKKYGKVVQLAVTFKNSSALSSGTIFQGVLSAQRPLFLVSTGMFDGTRLFVGTINASGSIVVKVFGGTTVANTSYTINFVYLTSA